jgi:hypothetical protein
MFREKRFEIKMGKILLPKSVHRSFETCFMGEKNLFVTLAILKIEPEHIFKNMREYFTHIQTLVEGNFEIWCPYNFNY